MFYGLRLGIDMRQILRMLPHIVKRITKIWTHFWQFSAALAALGLPWLIIDCFIHCVGFKAFQGKPEPRKTDGGHEEA